MMMNNIDKNRAAAAAAAALHFKLYMNKDFQKIDNINGLVAKETVVLRIFSLAN